MTETIACVFAPDFEFRPDQPFGFVQAAGCSPYRPSSQTDPLGVKRAPTPDEDSKCAEIRILVSPRGSVDC